MSQASRKRRAYCDVGSYADFYSFQVVTQAGSFIYVQELSRNVRTQIRPRDGCASDVVCRHGSFNVAFELRSGPATDRDATCMTNAAPTWL